MQHRFGAPPCLVVEVVVFGEATGIHRAEVRTHAGPTVGAGLSPVVKTCPEESTGEEGALIVNLPPCFRTHRVIWIVHVVGADVSPLLVGNIDATRTVFATGFASDRGLMRKRAVKIVDVLPGVHSSTAQVAGVVEALHVDDGGNTFAPAAIHRDGDAARGIELSRQPFHARRNSRSTR